MKAWNKPTMVDLSTVYTKELGSSIYPDGKITEIDGRTVLETTPKSKIPTGGF